MVISEVLDALDREGYLTRRELVRETGIPRTTIYDALHKLKKQGFVDYVILRENKRGRPKVGWYCANE